jgi:signal peptidase II
VQNPGAAFGMFRNMASSFFITLSVAAVIFVIYLLRKRTYNPLGLSFILGGAIGNLIDRILYGKVVDFIDFSIGDFHWYTFNIADSALTVGVAIIIVSLLFQKKG